MGKYDAVLADLRPRPVEDAGWQAKVDAEKIKVQQAPICCEHDVDQHETLEYRGDDKPRHCLAAGCRCRRLETTNGSSTWLAAMYGLARAEKELKAAELAVINVKVAALEQLLAESQDQGAEGWGQYGVADNALRLPDGSTVRIQKEPYGKVVDKEAFRLWCIENGYGPQLMLWPSTTNLIVKERLLAGEPEPAGIEAFFLTKVVFTEGK